MGIGGKTKSKKTSMLIAKIVAKGEKTFCEDTARGRFNYVKPVYCVTKNYSVCFDIAGLPPANYNQCKKSHQI